MTAHTSVLVVYADVEPQLEDEFNRWYDEVHIPDVLSRCAHWVAARRYKLAGPPPANQEPVARYLCIWEIDTDDIDAADRTLREGLVEPREQGRLEVADQMTYRFRAMYTAVGRQPSREEARATVVVRS